MKHNSLDNTQSIPLHRVAVVRPFAQFLTDVGAPVEREFQRAGMPFSALENVNNYVPSHRFWTFLINAVRNEGIDSLGFHVGHKYGANCADPKLTDLLRRSPTLYHGLMKASELINKTVTHCQVGLIPLPNRRYDYFYHRPSCDADNSVIDQIGWFGLMTLIGMVRVFTGPKWCPDEIGLMTYRTPCDSIREQFPDTCIRLSQPFSYIALEHALLGLPPLNDETAAPGSLPLHYESLASDFIDSFTKVLISYVRERDLSLELAAQLCETSKRNLQRKLMEKNTRYSEVLDQARFHAARKMLQDPDMKVTDVSHLLGYSDPTHFARAFRRVAGVNPLAYRQAQALNASTH